MTETSWINGPFYNFSFYICLQLKSENYGRNFQISIIKARSSNSQDIYPNMLLLSSLKYYFRKKCIPLGNKSQVWKSTEKRRFNLLTYFRYMWVYLYRHRYKNRLWTTSTYLKHDDTLCEDTREELRYHSAHTSLQARHVCGGQWFSTSTLTSEVMLGGTPKRRKRRQKYLLTMP